jgi:two-component system phosphate regulon sensor histidine kinase PhoR
MWLNLAVLLPLLVLGGLAWLGTRAQVRAAWTVARDEAKAAGGFAAEKLSNELAGSLESTPWFADPPLPGTATAADAVLDGTDLTALRQLRDDPAAGLSPAGLPRQVIAGLRAFNASHAAEDAAVLLGLAATGAPSVVSPVVFQQLGDDAHDWQERWVRGDPARALFRRHPETAASGTWHIYQGNPWWLAADRGTLRFLAPSALHQALVHATAHLPKWAEARITLDGRLLAGSTATGEVMASDPLGFANNLQLEILAARPAGFEAGARQQARWTLGVLACAVAIAAAALAVIHRTLARERRLHELKSQFVASVSHELRAPVASIRLMADALEANKIPADTAKEFHCLIARESARLATLVGNVLDHARIEQGRRVWHIEPSDLTALTTETLRVMEPLAQDKNITLRADLQALEAAVDAGAIQQALVNLLDNAIKFSPPASTVTTTLSNNNGWWELTVRDEGPGIPKHEQARVFERFYRLGHELRRETQGTGIGLSLVKSITAAHGGRVCLTSETGHGCAFTLTAPLNPHAEP